MASDGHNPRELSVRDAGRIADAFEISRDQVLEDVELATGWQGTEEALAALLESRHNWDSSVVPFYLQWLKPDGSDHSLEP